MDNSESDGKALRVPPLHKLSPIESDHQHAGLSVDGLLFVGQAEPGSALQTRTRILPPQPPSTPTVAPETEATGPVQSQPVREISLRLAVTASSPVDVLVAERGGKVQVAVRTADPDLARSLQSNLGELVGHLETKGFRTDAWTPVAAQHGGPAVGEPSTLTDSRNHSDDSRSGGGRHDPRQAREESNQRRQGRSKAKFEETLSMPHAPA